MRQQAIRAEKSADEFTRLHRLFVEHFGFAVGIVWLASSAAALHAPWARNFRGLLDPAARPESTLSFLLAFPLLMTFAWVAFAFGGDMIRRTQVLRSQRLEFGLAAVAAFAVFCMAVQRVVTVVTLS